MPNLLVIMKAWLAALLALFSLSGFAQRLVTDSFDITIDVRCEEGVVACDKVRYKSVNRKNGKSITLNGKDMHTRCADGVTPCRFLGYVFRNGKTTYTVWENGILSIKQGSKVLLEEQGTWRDVP
jgi:hypothetical protein